MGKQNKPASGDSTPEDGADVDTTDGGASDGLQEVVEAVVEQLRPGMRAAVQEAVDALSVELRAELQDGLEACRRGLSRPPPPPAEAVYYEHQVPRMLHRKHGGRWETRRVDTAEQCQEALEAGWRLRPE